MKIKKINVPSNRNTKQNINIKQNTNIIAYAAKNKDLDIRLNSSSGGIFRILAEKIIDKAKEAKVPVHKDSKLADTLSKLEIGEAIPQELYEVVAEILVFVDQMDRIKEKIDANKTRISATTSYNS